jgi:hypothetical protein
MMKRNHTSGFILLIFSFILLWSCEQFQAESDDPVLARVGNQTLTLSKAIDNIPRSVILQDTLSAIQQYQSNWVEQKVLENEARRIGLDNNRDFIQRIERLKSQLLQSALTDAILNQHLDDLEVSFEEAQNYYQANRDRFILDEKYIRFRHMTTRTRVESDNAKRDLMRGDSWVDVANRYSINPEVQIRESERFIPISMAVADVPSMNRFLNVIGITEISPTQQHGGYYHFVQLLEERPEGDHPDLDWLMDQITDWLFMERSQRVINTYKRNLYLQAEANNEIEKTNVEDFDESMIINVLQRTNN